MPCLVGCLALFFPRLAIVLVWLFSTYLQTAYHSVHVIWPILGFFLMPLTVLAYALAWHIPPRGSLDGIGVAVVVVAVLIDLGIIGGGVSSRRVRGYYGARR
jgi:hypothetical protein